MNRTILSLFTSIFVFASTAFAQGTISGSVSDSEGNALPGANVVIVGTQLGAAATLDGGFSINAPDGSYTVTASVVGYKSASANVRVNGGNVTANFTLEATSVALGGVEVLANRVDDNDAVSYDNYTKQDIDFRLGGRGLPKALSTLPNVFVNDGGGWDDENVWVRGFTDNYTAYMINGVPMNDMENGNLYFSNWSVLADVASVVQVQRGAGAINLAVPSVGGSVNFISSPASSEAGYVIKQLAGTNSLQKTAITLNAGTLLDGKMTLVAAASRRTADRLHMEGTYSKAWAYYFNSSYSFDDNNRLEFVALGSPQEHGQSYYNNRVSNYSHELAKEMGVKEEDLRTEYGTDYNARWGKMDTVLKGRRAMPSWKPFDGWNYRVDEYSRTEMNEKMNYFHKPIVQVNSYNKISDNMMMSTSLYYSGGEGGGSGSWGSDGVVRGDANVGKARDWQATYAQNTTNWVDGYGYESTGILRSSRNNQYTYGIMSKLDLDLSDVTSFTFGLDVRTAKIEHYREVHDLLGGDFVDGSYGGNENWTSEQVYRTLGDKIAYDNTNTVDWIGGYVQANQELYNGSKIYAMVGATTADYSVQDHWSIGEPTYESNGNEGYQFKLGGTLPLNDVHMLFGNVSFAELTPSLDKVLNDEDMIVNTDFENEKATWFDFGYRFKAPSGKVAGSVNYYYASWEDRVQKGSLEIDNVESFFNITGLNQLHTGIEYSIAFQPVPVLRIDLTGHKSDWKFSENLDYSYFETPGVPSTEESVQLYVKDVKIGGAPQQMHNLAFTGFFNRIKASVELQSFGDLYAKFGYGDNPADVSRSLGPNNTWAEDAWKSDMTTLVNLKLQYSTELAGRNITINAAMHNVTDELFVNDVVDFGAGDVAGIRVRLGQPQHYTIGVTISQ
ncbi:MAG: TonB-dependent receptor [Candidatus Neomarinimicrobiota bacterium]